MVTRGEVWQIEKSYGHEQLASVSTANSSSQTLKSVTITLWKPEKKESVLFLL